MFDQKNLGLLILRLGIGGRIGLARSSWLLTWSILILMLFGCNKTIEGFTILSHPNNSYKVGGIYSLSCGKLKGNSIAGGINLNEDDYADAADIESEVVKKAKASFNVDMKKILENKNLEIKAGIDFSKKLSTQYSNVITSTLEDEDVFGKVKKTIEQSGNRDFIIDSLSKGKNVVINKILVADFRYSLNRDLLIESIVEVDENKIEGIIQSITSQYSRGEKLVVGYKKDKEIIKGLRKYFKIYEEMKTNYKATITSTNKLVDDSCEKKKVVADRILSNFIQSKKFHLGEGWTIKSSNSLIKSHKIVTNIDESITNKSCETIVSCKVSFFKYFIKEK